MTIMTVVLICICLTFLVERAGQGIKRAKSKPKASIQPIEEIKQNIVFRNCLVDVEPAPLKVRVFLDGKIEGTLVMHGPYEGVVKRHLLLWKGDKHRCIKLVALCGVQIETIEQEYSNSFEEARRVAQCVFGKKNRAIKTAATTEHVMTQLLDVVPPVPVSVVAEQKAKEAKVTATLVDLHEGNAPSERVAPIVKGFISRYVGRIVEAGVKPNVKSGPGGITESYSTFTLTLDTPDGPEHLTGNDLKRALSDADVKVGDQVLAVHVKNVELPSGFHKKSFAISKLPQ